MYHHAAPGLSPKHTLRLYHLKSNVTIFVSIVKKTQNKQKEARFGHAFTKKETEKVKMSVEKKPIFQFRELGFNKARPTRHFFSFFASNFVTGKDLSRVDNGCGSVGRVAASYSIGPRFKSIHRQNIYLILFTVNFIEKTKMKKDGRKWPI